MENETKLCKHCRTEIPKKAKVCPNCRKKQGGKLKWVIIALVAICIIGSVLGGNSDEKDVATDGIATKTETSADVENKSEETAEDENVITVGGSFEKDGLKITVNEVSTDFQDYKDEYGFNTPEDGMKYVMASFTFENNGDSDAYVSIYDFTCYADNATCEQVYGLDDSDFMNTNLSNGRNVSFKTYYKVPTDSETIELEYETNIWTSEKVIIKIN